jgi:hypothetical protein
LNELTTIIIPQTVTSIASHAMSYCAKLTIGFEATELPTTLGDSWNSGSGYYLNVKEFVVYDDATYVTTNDGNNRTKNGAFNHTANHIVGFCQNLNGFFIIKGSNACIVVSNNSTTNVTN